MEHNDICEVSCTDGPKVARVKTELTRQSTEGAARIFKALSDETRVRITYALAIENELCVCDVAHIVGSSVATASHHLRTLKNFGITKFRKEGKLVYYSLDDDHVRQLVQIALAHQKEVDLRAGS